MQQWLSFQCLRTRHFYNYFALPRKFNGIANQIDQALPNSLWITHHKLWDIVVYVDDQLKILVRGLKSQHGADIFHVAAQVHFHFINFKLAGFNLRKIQQIVDHR